MVTIDANPLAGYTCGRPTIRREHGMRLRKPGAGTRVVLVAVSALLVISAFALPALAAGQRTQFIHTHQFFERAQAGNTSNSDCASGTFEASGVVSASGNARTCARHFRPPSIVQGTTQLHNGDDLTVDWKIQCDDTDGRARHFECTGQWTVRGPNWRGGGNTRVVLDFLDGPYGSVDFTFNGKIGPA
jgi:hypothetical protein